MVSRWLQVKIGTAVADAWYLIETIQARLHRLEMNLTYCFEYVLVIPKTNITQVFLCVVDVFCVLSTVSLVYEWTKYFLATPVFAAEFISFIQMITIHKKARTMLYFKFILILCHRQAFEAQHKITQWCSVHSRQICHFFMIALMKSVFEMFNFR